MEGIIKEIGNMICNMVMEVNIGRTVQNSKENIKKERNLELVIINGVSNQVKQISIKENGLIMKSME